MLENKSVYLRWVLSVGLCYLIYGETGPFTTLGFVLIVIASETVAWRARTIVNGVLRKMKEKLEAGEKL